MNDKLNTNGSYSGIKITDNISLSLPNKNSWLDYVPLVLTAIFGCFGTLYSFISMFRIDVDNFSLNFYTFVFIMIFSAVFINKKSITGPLIPIFLIYEFVLYRKWNSYINGLMLVCNQVYQVIYPSRDSYFRIDDSVIDPDSDIKIFIIFTLFLLTMIICCISIIKPDFFFGFLFTFPFVEIGLFYGKTPDLIPAFFLIIYWTAILAVHQSGYYRSSRRSKTGFVRKGNSFFSKPAIKFQSAGHAGAIIILSSFTLITSIVILIELSGYTRSVELNTMRSNVKTAVSEFSFDDIGGSLERLSASFGLGSIKTYDHRLGSMNSVSFSGKTDLTVTVDHADIPYGNVYLKGYVGSVYDGKSWELLDDKIYDKNSDLLSLFSKNGLYPQDMLYENYGKPISLVGDLSGEPKYIAMQIESSVVNDKYCYTPYNSVPVTPRADISYIDDTIMEFKNKNKYSFEVSPYQDFYDAFNDPKLLNDEVSIKYHDFVYENYLDVPNNADTEKLYNTFIDGNIYKNTYRQLQYIKMLLSDNAEYSLEPGKTPSGKDFISYFLTENHKGYCVHFASAGVILARMSGIPARYVEGYVMLKEDFIPTMDMEDSMKSTKKIEIKDERAHAWAEIYIDGYGWIPYEFTPSSAAAFGRSHTSNDVTMPKVTIAPISMNLQNHTGSTSTTLKKQETTVNTQSYAPHRTDKKSDGKFMARLSPEAKYTIAVISASIMLMLIIAAVHYFVVKKRERDFSQNNNSKNAINAYNYIIKLLDFCDIKNENMQYLEFAEFVEHDEKRIFKSGELTEVTYIALEAGMSKKEISEEKAKKAIIVSYRTALTIFRKQNLFGKLYMKFIRNLC